MLFPTCIINLFLHIKLRYIFLMIFVCFSPICDAEEKTFITILKMKNYNSQDSLRDSMRFALYQVSNKNLSFWAREYPINGGFYKRGDICEIQIIKGRPELHYKLWMQEKKAPLIFLLPGIGSHFQGMGVNAMAQTYFDRGYSVAILSSAMNWEFYLAASRSKAPGHVPLDAEDIQNALKKIVAEIKKDYSGKITKLHLIGYSMGGLHTLFIAELESKAKEKIGIDSYLSIHPPVDIYSSMTTLDDFWNKWHAWKPEDAAGKVESGVAAYLNLTQYGLPKDKRIPISQDRAKVLIAYAYRSTLRELLLAISKQKNDMGLLKEEYGFTKGALYKEIDQVSFAQYAKTFLQKSTSDRLGKTVSLDQMAKQSNLHNLEPFLSKADNITVIHALDDFLINKKDITWLGKTLDKRVYFFRHGGHLGELYTPEAKIAIVKYLKK